MPVDGRHADLRALELLAAEQHQVFSRDQALRNGFTRDMQYDRRASGNWVELLPGVMRFASAPVTFRMRAMAAVLWSAPDGVVSHVSAGRLWDFEGVPRDPRLHLTVPSARRLRSGVVTVHRTTALVSADRAVAHGIAVTSPVRTVLDLAAVLDDRSLALAIEDALRRNLFRVRHLERRAADRRGKGIAGTRVIADLIGGHGSVVTDSGWEVRLARLLVDAGFPEPRRQLRVDTINGPRHVDLAYPGNPVVAFEYDSDRWHSGVARRHADMERRNALRAAGCVVVEVTSALMAEPSRLVATIRAVIESSASHAL
jgi:hypothetical protein